MEGMLSVGLVAVSNECVSGLLISGLGAGLWSEEDGFVRPVELMEAAVVFLTPSTSYAPGDASVAAD